MRVVNFNEQSATYTSRVYCILGSWNALPDVNTLVDVGRDPDIVMRLESLNTGLGKKKIDQVIITHNHYDHTGVLSRIIDRFSPRVLAFSSSVYEVDRCLQDGEHILCGDEMCEIIHVPGHSHDSICLYAPLSKILFSGDTPFTFLRINSAYREGFLSALERLASLDVQCIYPGHGYPIKDKCNQLIHKTLEVVSLASKKQEAC
jgi:glyoxylase-like metal-dependent hydrolase (beta-lactamase superfamily II)